MTPVRWVMFDCFGTLVDWRSGFAAILTPLAGHKTPDVMRAYDRIERILEAETPHRLYRDVLTGGLLCAADEVGVALSESHACRLPEQWGTMPVFEDVEPMLADLRADGCRLAVLTNCDDDLFAETQRAFRAPFDLVVTAERVRAEEFMSAVFDMEPGAYLITDESSLHDFEDVEEMRLEDIHTKIMSVFDVDVRDVRSGNLVEIFARIHRQRYGEPG